MRHRSVPWPLVSLAVGAMSAFVAITVVVTRNRALALDSWAFKAANDIREPGLDQVARTVTHLGLIAVAGPAVALGALLLFRRRYRFRATALVAGAALTWVSVWITKAAVDRPRPPASLVGTSGQSYPSAHAANSVGWLALAIALTVEITLRPARIAAITAGGLVAVIVGLSRIYLRAHYASDVLAGEALALAIYALAALAAISGERRAFKKWS
jgi:membrane-associated phospholipid phosphatase